MDDTWITCVTPPWWIRLRCAIWGHDWYALADGLPLRRQCTVCRLTTFADGNTGYAWAPKQRRDEATRTGSDRALADEIDAWLRRRRA